MSDQEDQHINELGAIAAAMGNGWVHNKVQQRGYCHYLTNGNQCIQVMYERGSNHKRVSMSLCFEPYHPVSADHRNKITVSLNRSPRALAADIKRRLLPNYAENLQQAIDEHNERENKKALGEFIIESFKRITPLEYYPHCRKYQFGCSRGVSGWLEQRYSDKERIDLELQNLTPEQTVKVLALLRDDMDKAAQEQKQIDEERKLKREEMLANFRKRQAERQAKEQASA
ncbi:hypothetical protein [Vibrio owensii]|uniref:hypothetical protein n=1 Tax=Vibrio owensii TaxID=696485 RepID=UPI0038CDF6C9